MDYSRVIAVTGLPGLYELVSSKSDGAIVRSLEDKSTRFVSNRVHNFSHLESIEVFTIKDNVNLVDVFKAIEDSGEKIPDDKDAAAVKKYMEKICPDIDFERVYNSDLKKMVKWFTILKANDIEIKLTELPEEEPELEPAPAPEPVKKAPKKKAAEAEEKKPIKTVKAKAAPKEKEEAPKKKVAKPKKETPAETPKKKSAKKK